jgi:ATP-dependent Clp protease ATP-binding subunit ClpC
VAVDLLTLGDRSDVETLIAEARNAGNVILFLDQLHLLFGGEGGIDLSPVFVPVLARQQIRCIGTTTLGDYRKYLEVDGALERRFQEILVSPSSKQEAIEILRSLRGHREERHQVQIADEGIVAAVELAHRYIHGHCLPGSAIDLLDRACAGSDGVVDWEAVGRVMREERGRALPWLDRAAEMDRFQGLEEELQRAVVGQEDAIRLVARAVRQGLASLCPGGTPRIHFLFTGRNHAAKVVLARKLAGFLFGDEEALVRIDLSEYTEGAEATRLRGLPPGYIGYEDGGVLTEPIRSRPYCVVMIEHVERGHPDCRMVLRMVLEEGNLVDNLGRRVEFQDTVVILTSDTLGEWGSVLWAGGLVEVVSL